MWRKKFEAEAAGSDLNEDERLELARLRAENKRLRRAEKKLRPSVSVPSLSTSTRRTRDARAATSEREM